METVKLNATFAEWLNEFKETEGSCYRVSGDIIMDLSSFWSHMIDFKMKNGNTLFPKLAKECGYLNCKLYPKINEIEIGIATIKDGRCTLSTVIVSRGFKIDEVGFNFYANQFYDEFLTMLYHLVYQMKQYYNDNYIVVVSDKML